MPNFKSAAAENGEALVRKVLETGLQGAGPFKGAEAIATEALRHTGGDIEKAIDRVVSLHTRLAGIEGFATGVPGGIGAFAAVPADLTAFYILAGRMVGGVAYLRGYDLGDDAVRSMILIALLGSSGAAILREFGVTVGAKSATAALKKLPGRVLIDINKKVGYRLITKFGEKGVINLGKLVPFVGGPIGLVLNATSMRTLGAFAKIALPPVESTDSAEPPTSGTLTRDK